MKIRLTGRQMFILNLSKENFYSALNISVRSIRFWTWSNLTHLVFFMYLYMCFRLL